MYETDLLNKYANSPNGNLHILLIYSIETNHTWNDLILYISYFVFCIFGYGRCLPSDVSAWWQFLHVESIHTHTHHGAYFRFDGGPLCMQIKSRVHHSKSFTCCAYQIFDTFFLIAHRIIADCIIAILPKWKEKKQAQTQSVISLEWFRRIIVSAARKFGFH